MGFIFFLVFLVLAFYLLDWFIVFVSEPYLPYCDKEDTDGRTR